MCKISDKIKFCSCKLKKKDGYKHYWVHFRYNKNIEEFAMGEPVMPTYLMDSDFVINESTLLFRLNEPDAFDFQTNFKSKDKILIVINDSEKSD
ncbi:hypothetical protein [Christiangramia salexigens]|uniref:Uncharacterized protein n=1 Tax=Christiangramia salexigens TaxID=1913577 RepID=A0A1L3J2H9_9FLAO|nr:hypothetical protein [Christiangramia salexigens]APG59329.1 hypothetical protein LPB144_02385 [Christiangramia salexigens]